MLPPELSTVASVGLVVTSFFTAALTAALGLGGGVLLLAVMAVLMPGAAIIPVHGVVQLASNAGRALVQGRHAKWAFVAWFSAGSAAGALLGGRVAVSLPVPALQAILALFILWAVLGPPPRLGMTGGSRWIDAGGGAFAAFLTMFIGATGPFVMALLAPRKLPRLELVGTHAVAMTLQHGLKVAAFGALGFRFAPWIGLLAAMVVAGFGGTLVGTHILKRLPQARFERLLSAVMLMLAAYLGYRALTALVTGAP